MSLPAPSFTYCHPGDDNRKRWLLVFDDVDQGISVFFDEDEAMRAWESANDNWNCHLFVSVPLRNREAV
jgi:hypothetical protein